MTFFFLPTVILFHFCQVRVWDLSDLCSDEFTQKGVAIQAQHRPNSTQQRQRPRGPPDGYGYGDYTQQHEQQVIYDCVPLLWESPYPIHGQDTSRLSLVASVMGAVFNVAPGGLPRTLLDAQMASPHHLVTVGADGLVVLTRI